jgi:ribosomal-protein-alanine N-acetyltransferase
MSISLTIPEIETDRLVLRGWRESDLNAHAAFWADEESVRHLGGTANRSDVWRMIAAYNGMWSLRGFGFMAVEEKASGDLIGMAGPLYPEGWPEPEIGWSIYEPYRRRGYASEAGAAALKFAYGALGWKTAISLIDARNEGSVGVAQKLGARLEQHDVPVTTFTANIWRHLPPEEFLAQHGGAA